MELHIGIDSSPSDFAISAILNTNDGQHVLKGFKHVSRSSNVDFNGFLHTTIECLKIILRASKIKTCIMIESAIDPNKRPNEFEKHMSLKSFNEKVFKEAAKAQKEILGYTCIRSFEPNTLRDRAGLKWRRLADEQEYIHKSERKLIKHICYDLLREQYEILPKLNHGSHTNYISGYVHVDQDSDNGWYDIADSIIAALASTSFLSIS